MKTQLFLLFMAMLLTSCAKDWLNERPDKNLKVAVTISDAEQLLDGVGMNNSGLGLNEVASPGHYVTEQRWLQGFPTEQINAYTWTNDFPYLKLVDWQLPYSGILYANIALNTLNGVTPTNPVEMLQKKQVEGNALFHRARYHFELAQLYCPPYDPSGVLGQFGIPLRLEADPASTPKRSTIEQTYNQVLKDLFQAKDLLPNLPKYKTRGSKASVYALLSNVYMTMRRYDLSKVYADSCLAIQSQLLDFNTVNSSLGYLGQFNTEVIFHSAMSNRASASTSARVDQELYNMFNNNDLRKTKFFKINADNTVTFTGNYNSSNAILFAGLAVDEMLLNRAEGYAREGNLVNAMDDLNRLLKSRWSNTVSYPKVVAGSAAEALSIIITERKKELMFRGRMWMDLRRLNFESQFKSDYSRTIGGKTYTLEANSYKYTFPIPNDEISMTGMSQNPGWK